MPGHRVRGHPRPCEQPGVNDRGSVWGRALVARAAWPGAWRGSQGETQGGACEHVCDVRGVGAPAEEVPDLDTVRPRGEELPLLGGGGEAGRALVEAAPHGQHHEPRAVAFQLLAACALAQASQKVGRVLGDPLRVVPVQSCLQHLQTGMELSMWHEHYTAGTRRHARR